MAIPGYYDGRAPISYCWGCEDFFTIFDVRYGQGEESQHAYCSECYGKKYGKPPTMVLDKDGKWKDISDIKPKPRKMKKYPYYDARTENWLHQWLPDA